MRLPVSNSHALAAEESHHRKGILNRSAPAMSVIMSKTFNPRTKVVHESPGRTIRGGNSRSCLWPTAY